MSTLNEMAKDFLAQNRIAVVGVSRSAEETGNYIYRALRDKGYEVFPVNPNAEMVEGVTCYSSVKDIPSGVGGAVLITSPAATEQVVRDCAEAGVRRVWMHDNTFGGTSASEKAIAFCQENNITVIPGACPMMYLDFGHKCMRWMLGAMGRLPR